MFISVLISACSYPPLKNEPVGTFSDYSYQIGSGDGVSIFVWDNPDISTTVTVRPDGKITVPLVEDLLVTGQTPYQVARKLEEVYRKFIRDPQVVVMMTAFQGVDSQQIRVIGQISGSGGGGNRSGGGGGGGRGSNAYQALTLPYERGMTLLDVIIRIGSIGEFADGNRASILRKVNGVQKRYSVKLDDLVEDADISENVSMLPGDILIIPEAFF